MRVAPAPFAALSPHSFIVTVRKQDGPHADAHLYNTQAGAVGANAAVYQPCNFPAVAAGPGRPDGPSAADSAPRGKRENARGLGAGTAPTCAILEMAGPDVLG